MLLARLSRFCSEVAKILRVNHQTSLRPMLTMAMVSLSSIRVRNCRLGSQKGAKNYRYYTGHMGGLREIPFLHMRARHPDYAIRVGVKGMMPKSRLGKQQMRKLRIFKGEEHPFIAQQPVKVNV